MANGVISIIYPVAPLFIQSQSMLTGMTRTERRDIKINDEAINITRKVMW